MGKVPTLQEWSPLKFDGEMKYNKTDMIEFAKLHVEAALKEANLEALKFVDEDEDEDYKPQILNSYPLDNIK